MSVKNTYTGRKNQESVSRRKVNTADSSNKMMTEKCPLHLATQRLLVNLVRANSVNSLRLTIWGESNSCMIWACVNLRAQCGIQTLNYVITNTVNEEPQCPNGAYNSEFI